MEAVAPLSQSSPPSIYLEEAFEDVGPRVQHLRQAFRKSLASTVKRSTYYPSPPKISDVLI
jgi:hypothetical protein